MFPHVSEAMLIEALDAMARGDIEYVILEEGEAFLQAAGSGDSVYQVQYRKSEAEPLIEMSGSIDSQTVRRVHARLSAERRRLAGQQSMDAGGVMARHRA